MRGRAQLLGLAAWLAISFAAAAVGGLASVRAQDFYVGLEQPGWAPPASVFGPVWTVLYALMGVAAWLVWRERGLGGARGALALFVAQLVANALWTWLFFAWRLGAAAFVEILILLVLIAATLAAFSRVRIAAGALLLPYLLWVAYATALTWSLWQRNPQLLG
ncbi:MAG: tryptophan-rich sensory protein [Gammaproteobacteria bacterium]|nr:tryptophan-rich sensory protein [Gammaproteobacteria bacterium]